METKMLRWTTGVTHLGCIRKTMKYTRCLSLQSLTRYVMLAFGLRWYGHVLRGRGDTVRNTGLNIDVLGSLTGSMRISAAGPSLYHGWVLTALEDIAISKIPSAACCTTSSKEELLQNPIASRLKYSETKIHHHVNASNGFNVVETVMRALKTKNINGVLKLWIARN
ncbi:unnamed protein product [Heligmosomoides polygyrus]|uniref:Pentatricopeptide repeat-containing protein n=1 Tax=Heligmosomoides polygyrus TaxID=6339 RepID=A0A183G9Z6_HELPZ|nr:unnamed protein product [Heligmosomoides polygyrus]